MNLTPEDLRATIKGHGAGGYLEGSLYGNTIASFLAVLDELEPDLEFKSAVDRISFLRNRYAARRVVHQAGPPATQVNVEDLLEICTVADRSFRPGWRTSAGLLDVTFMSDDPRAAIVNADYVAASVALRASQFKVAVVFSGSAAEGMLQFAVERAVSRGAIARWPKDVSKTGKKWSLHQMVSGARMNGLITEFCKDAATALRQSRNLIHPALVADMNVLFDRGIAEISVGAVARIATELKVWTAANP